MMVVGVDEADLVISKPNGDRFEVRPLRKSELYLEDIRKKAFFHYTRFIVPRIVDGEDY